MGCYSLVIIDYRLQAHALEHYTFLTSPSQKTLQIFLNPTIS